MDQKTSDPGSSSGSEEERGTKLEKKQVKIALVQL